MNPRELIQPCLDADGLVAPVPIDPPPPATRNSSGNGLMYRAEYEIEIQSMPGFVDMAEFRDIIRACEAEPGNLKRGPVHPDQNDHDDYTGVAAASTWAASRILSRGRAGVPVQGTQIRWVYNNVCPGTFWHPGEPRSRNERIIGWLLGAPAGHRVNGNAFLGRFPHLIAHFQWAAGETPPLWRRLIWCLVVATACWGDPKQQDGWRLTYLMAHVAPPRSPEMCAVSIWRTRFRKHWPGGIAEVRRRYFGWNHPLAVLAETRPGL